MESGSLSRSSVFYLKFNIFYGNVVVNVSLLASDSNKEVYKFHVYVYFGQLTWKTVSICLLPVLIQELVENSLGY